MTEAQQDALIDALVTTPAGELAVGDGPAWQEERDAGGRAPGPSGGSGTPGEPGSREDGAVHGEASPESDPFASPTLTARERAILTYADRLTVAPASIAEADVRPLRDVGLDDRGIHDVCAIVAYFAFVNRMADGLGVELENDDTEWKDVYE